MTPDRPSEYVGGFLVSLYNIAAAFVFRANITHEDVNQWLTTLSLVVGIAVGLVTLYRYLTRKAATEP